MTPDVAMVVAPIGCLREEGMKPDSEFVEQNSHGRAMFTYIAKYSMEEKTCNIQFQAFSDEDAQQRIEEMKASLQAIGQIYKAFRR